jgi:AcrR family transcriptional regulator
MKGDEKKDGAVSRRDHLLDTAWRLFCASGYRAIGIDSILKEAGVAKMTLYHHFGSKDELIAATVKKKGEETLAELDELLNAAGSGPEDKLEALFDWLDAWLSSDEFSGCPYLKAIGEYTGESDAPRRAAADFKNAIQQRLEVLSRAAGLEAPEILARRLTMVLDGAIVHSDLHRDPSYVQDAKAIAATLIESHRRMLEAGKG